MNIFLRSWNRFTRIPMFHPFRERLNDLLRRRSFNRHIDVQKALQAEYEGCRSTQDYVEFIAKVPDISSHQIEKEISAFLDFAATQSPALVCEVGTADGGTNFLLGQAIQSVKTIIGVDLYVRNRHQLRFFSKPGQEQLHLDGSSYAGKTVEKVRRVLNGRQLDLLFIDGDHTYEGVKKDFVLYKQFVREGGIIAFHDVVADHKTRFGRETGRWAGDVPLVWKELKPLYPSREFIDDPEQDGLGIGCLEYRAEVQLPAGYG